jgi:O-antigen ligase
MIRVVLLWAVVFGLAFYAGKDWYRALCGLVLLMAIIEHPDMPKSLLGLQGLNPWNLLLLIVILAWAVTRSREGLVWDMPGRMVALLMMYLAVVLVSLVRMMTDLTRLEDISLGTLVSEYLINTLKWVIPGLLLFDGCRTRSRFMLGLAVLLSVYVLLGAQVIRWMPTDEILTGETLSDRSLKILLNEVGYHRVNLSMMLAGASWAILATLPLATGISQRVLVIAASLAVSYAQALTGGRMGYVTWALLGLILGLVRWRKYLLLAPVVALAITWTVPSAVERMLQGFSVETRDHNVALTTNTALIEPEDQDAPDAYTVTAGRNVAWQYVIEKIGENPVFGYGRLAMQRTGLEAMLWEQFQESFPHPHNAYLEMLLDNGWLGLLLVMPFYVFVLRHAISLFRDERSPVFQAIGGVTCALVMALLLASFGSQTFYPREGSVGMWCAIGLLLRITVQSSRALAAAPRRAPETRTWGAPAVEALEGSLWARPA